MSAIFGIYFPDGRPVDMPLKAMADSLEHRGAESPGMWRQGLVGLGHRMLKTTPESLAERLPLSDKKGSLVVTADARLDNRKELIALLKLGNYDDGTIPDSRLILAAYTLWGEQTPERLVGDFAFAVWDAPRRTIFCARDAIGIRPFYYHHRPHRLFAFASEIKAVLTCPDVPRLLNEVRVADHLLQDFGDTKGTFYQAVYRLPAAHCMTVSSESIQMRRYWSLDSTRHLRLSSDEEYAEAFREIFTEAVRCRTRSAYPVGSTLSGGLDSSSIACTANLVLPDHQRPLRTFSAIFPGLPKADLPRIDERRYVDSVLQSGRFEQCYVRGDRVSPLLEWRGVFQHLDEACLAPNLYLHWELYRAAAGKGVRVLLDGLDGDTTVSHGLGHLTDLMHTGRWIRFWREARALSSRNPSAFPFQSVVWQLGIRPFVPKPVVRNWRTVRRPAVEDVQELISRALSERVGVRARSQGNQGDGLGVVDCARNEHREGLNSPLIPYAMELADQASSAFSVEVRYPFFDRRLIEFCLSIPGEQKLRAGWTRSVMRRAMTGILPAAVQWRVDKADLSPNFMRGLFERDGAIIKDVVTSRVFALLDFVDERAVRAAYRRWLAQPMRNQKDALTLYAVATLALWLETSGLMAPPRKPSCAA
jgi:asparagine synthase (glutamine-hydrolysing)